VAEVDRLFASLVTLEGAAPRILLMDQNEDGRLASVVAAWAPRLRLEHHVIPPRGVSQARNAGLALLTDEPFVAFPDDDCSYEPDALRMAEAVFARHSDVDALISAWSDFAEILPAASGEPAIQRCTRIMALRQSPTYTLFFRRAGIARARDFDETLGPGGGSPWLCGEDADFLLRAGGPEPRIASAPAVRVHHPRVHTVGDAQKAYGYGRGRMRVLAKHAYPWWFQVLSILHPLALCASRSSAERRFRWHLFRGRLAEWVAPHRPDRA
jgi:glycosyltransferase involved in cell wall biosynthesis